MDWPLTTAAVPPVIQTFSMECLGSPATALGSINYSDFSSGAYPAANLALYLPFFLTAPITVTTLFAFNGATATGNIDVGIYDTVGTRLVSAGSTAQSGTSVLQTFDVTDTVLGPGLFYLAVACSSASATLMRNNFSSASAARMAGMAQQATAFALPATATFAAAGQGYCPIIGLRHGGTAL